MNETSLLFFPSVFLLLKYLYFLLSSSGVEFSILKLQFFLKAKLFFSVSDLHLAVIDILDDSESPSIIMTELNDEVRFLFVVSYSSRDALVYGDIDSKVLFLYVLRSDSYPVHGYDLFANNLLFRIL